MTEPVLTTRPRGRRAVPAPTASTSPSPALDALTTSRSQGPHRDLPATELHPHPANPEHRSTEGFTELAEQIRADGKIRQPLVVRAVADGYEVLSGSRRLAAARLLGHVLVPTEVVDVDDRTALRMVLAENLNRMDFAPSEEAALVQDLLDLGLTDEALAAELGKGAEWIARRRAVAKLAKPARALVDARPDLDLVAEAATLDAVAEFEDAPDVVEHLTAVAVTQPSQLAHAVSVARRDRREAELEEPEKERRAEAGYAILTESPYNDPSIRGLWDLSLTAPAAGEISPPQISSDEHTQCPGRAVRVFAVGGLDSLELRVQEYCTTWKTEGHYVRYASSSSGSTSGPRTDEQNAERKHLVTTNKAAEAAAPVRRAWLEGFFRRDKMPADAIVYAAQILAMHYGTPAHASALALVGFKNHTYGTDPATQAHLAKPVDAHKHLVALAVSVVEDSMPKDYHRTGSAHYGRHLSQLQTWGYTLAPHEQDVVDAWVKAEKKTSKGRR